MKKLFIILAAMPLLTNAQDAGKNKTGNKLSIGFSFSPDYNYRALKNNDGRSSSDMVIDIRNDIEKGKFGFTTGLNLNVRLSDKLKVQTGVLYSNKGYKTPKRATDYPIPIPGQPTHFKSKAKFNYLDIPVKLNFISGKGRTKLIAGAGLIANFLLNESEIVTFIYPDGSEKKHDQSSGLDHNKYNLSSVISAGVDFKLKENVHVRAEPTFRYGLLTIIDQPVTAHLWNVGLNMSIYIQLKKLK